MVEHVRNGGKPYDVRGQHITTIVEELNILSRFRRANQGRLLEGDTAALVEQTNAYYATAQRTLKSLSTMVPAFGSELQALGRAFVRKTQVYDTKYVVID